MLDKEPQPNTTYKLVKVDTSMYFVDSPDLNKEQHWVVTKYGPDFGSTVDLLDKLVRDDLLPDWMHEFMRTLDVAGAGHSVPGIGKKIGSTYWINLTDEI